jgi:hypothetical protein
MELRKDEAPKLWFRSERFFRCNGRWYFHTREGFAVGPYDSRLATEIDAGILIDQLRQAPPEQAVSVIRDFIMHTGGDLDYANDPAFTAYLISEDDSALDERRV